jgi:hypothetical protein
MLQKREGKREEKQRKRKKEGKNNNQETMIYKAKRCSSSTKSFAKIAS